MFVLRGQRAVAGNRGPAVGENLYVRLAEIDHRLDGENHARTHFRPLILLSVVKNVGGIVEKPSDAMTAEIAHDRATLALGMGLDDGADRSDTRTGLHLADAQHQALI